MPNKLMLTGSAADLENSSSGNDMVDFLDPPPTNALPTVDQAGKEEGEVVSLLTDGDLFMFDDDAENTGENDDDGSDEEIAFDLDTYLDLAFFNSIGAGNVIGHNDDLANEAVEPVYQPVDPDILFMI